MDFTGRLCEVSRDYMSRKPMLKFLINEEPNGIEDLDGKDLYIKVGRCAKPRSLNANNYFHALCDKLRQKLGISMAAMKNELITSYGQIEWIEEGVPAAFKSNVPPEKVRELETPHLKFHSMSGDGNYMYLLYRGSHTYNSREMSVLLEGTKQEAAAQGIETMTSDEIARLVSLWKGENDD